MLPKANIIMIQIIMNVLIIAKEDLIINSKRFNLLSQQISHVYLHVHHLLLLEILIINIMIMIQIYVRVNVLLIRKTNIYLIMKMENMYAILLVKIYLMNIFMKEKLRPMKLSLAIKQNQQIVIIFIKK